MSNVKIDNTVKRLEQDRNKVSDPKLKEEISSKIAALKNQKDVLK